MKLKKSPIKCEQWCGLNMCKRLTSLMDIGHLVWILGNGYLYPHRKKIHTLAMTPIWGQNRKYKLPLISAGADPGFGQGGGPASEAESCRRSEAWRASEASILQPGSRARLRALEAFGFLMLKYAFSHILETLFLLFLTSILTPKVDKNRALDFTSINLRHSDMLHLFFNLHEKVML